MTTRATQASLLTLATVLASQAGAQTTTWSNTTSTWSTGTTTTTTTNTAKPIKPQYRNVRAFYRNVRAFWGDVNPFYRNVRAFWGDVDPFYRNVRAFWGTMDPTAMATAAGAPSYAGVGTFWEGLGSQWETMAAPWQTMGAYSSSNATAYVGLTNSMKTLVSTSKNFWGAAVTKQTGKTFEAGFSDQVLRNFGISLHDPASLAKLTPAQQSEFFMAWYDGLMAFSGTDHADWWMRSVNWSPKLAQQVQVGSERRPILGLVDFYAGMDADVKSKTLYAGGTQTTNAHGAGVASLIVASHDGRDIMGVAPNSRVIAHNPFDWTESASFDDVGLAIEQVQKQAMALGGAGKGAHVVNLSLGTPLETLAREWGKVFNRADVQSRQNETLYVIAAGNEGRTPTQNINMINSALDTTFIVVGSVGPDNKISEFSNRPGTVCLSNNGECKNTGILKDTGQLMNRFIVAPGELILVSDGKGGVTRQSGTSLAAPLVSGAALLVVDRWPWLRDKPRDLAKVILDSATDLGAPGTDPVYGRGMLNVEGALSPLDFNKLTYTLVTSAGSTSSVSASTLKSGGIKSDWVGKNMFFTAFEQLENGQRDFLIPLDTRLYGTTRGGEYFQDYVYNRMVRWNGGVRFTGGRAGFADGTHSGTIAAPGGWQVAMSGRLVTAFGDTDRAWRPQLRSTVSLTAPDGGFGFAFGSGDGSVALGGQPGMALARDFDPYSGGANPLLGLASGGDHAAAQARVAPGLSIRAGFTEQRRSLGMDLADNPGVALDRLERYRSQATAVQLDYQPAAWLTLTASATRLREPNALFGVRALAASDLAGGTTTEGATVGAHADLGSGVTLFGSRTLARGRSPGTDGSLRIGADGLRAGSFQAGIAKHGVLGAGDALRLSVAQPLRVTGGTLELTEVQVIDRDTGQTGVVTQRFDAGDAQPRRLVLEGNYGTALLGGRAQFSIFGRGEMRDLDQGTPRLMLGSQLQVGF